MEEKGPSRSGNRKHFDKSKGHSGKRFFQAVFGFEKSIRSIIPSAKLHNKGGALVNMHLHISPLFAITTGWAGKDERTCALRVWKSSARGLTKLPALLQPLVENLKEDHGKAISLDHEDKEGFSEPIEFLAGLICQGCCGFHGSCRDHPRRPSQGGERRESRRRRIRS
jgi:hypothetical protein